MEALVTAGCVKVLGRQPGVFGGGGAVWGFVGGTFL